MKRPREHIVPLTDRMIAILDHQEGRRISAFVFPGRLRGVRSRRARQPMCLSASSGSGARRRSMAGDRSGGTPPPTSSGWNATSPSFSAPTRSATPLRPRTGGGTALERRRVALDKYGAWLAGEGEAVVIPFTRATG